MDDYYILDKINWNYVERNSKSLCTCNSCGKVFVSHYKFVREIGKLISKDKCPNCQNRVLKVVSTMEEV